MESTSLRSQLRRLAIVLVLAAVPRAAAAQQASAYGAVRDSAGAPVVSALVALETPERGVVAQAATDTAGAFRLAAVAPGEYVVRAQRIGYVDLVDTVTLAPGPNRLALVLAELPVEIAGLSVVGDRERQRFEDEAGLTAAVIDADQLQAVPGVAEPDVLRAVEVLPGVVSTSDFSAAFNVRGGAADQNLILLDGIPIYNPFHLGGLFSVFNSDFVESATLLSGGFPARYGGRVSSVLDVASDPGDGELRGDAGVSLLAARASVAGAVPDAGLDALGLRGGEWRVGVRRSYFDALLKPFFEFPYHLTDAQASVRLDTRAGDRLTLTGYLGSDVLDLSRLDTADFPLRVRWDWGNQLVGAHWIRPRGDDRLLDVSVGYTRFHTALGFVDYGDTDLRSTIDQLLGRARYHFAPAPGVEIETGVEADRYRFDNYAATGGTVFNAASDDAAHGAGFLSASVRRGRWLLEPGLRLDTWRARGGATFTDLAPRVAVKRFLGPDAAVKLAAGRYTQYLHSIRNEELPIGLDVWVTAGRNTPAVVSDQIQLGVERFVGDDWFVSLEGYLRRFDGLAALNLADDPDDPTDDLVTGSGRSKGADLLVRRDAGAGPHGWLSVSLLRATRTFPDVTAPPPADGVVRQVTYAPVYDRRLDVDLVLSQKIGAGELGLRWNFGTGLPYTRPIGGYDYYNVSVASGGLTGGIVGDSTNAVLLGSHNAERYPGYHRLDVSYRRTFEKSWGTLTPYVQVVNLYNRRNVLFYFYEYDADRARRTGLSMFPVLPTFGLEASF